MTQITKTELVEVLGNVTRPTFTNIVMETKPKMRKTNNPYFDKVIKKTNGRYFIGMDYEKRVIGNLTKEGVEEPQFESKKNNVGEHVNKCVLFNQNTQKFYLFYERFDEVKPKVEFIFEGNTIEKQLFESFMSQSSNYNNQDLERTVKVQSVSFDNIKQISVNGEVYEVI